MAVAQVIVVGMEVLVEELVMGTREEVMEEDMTTTTMDATLAVRQYRRFIAAHALYIALFCTFSL